MVIIIIVIIIIVKKAKSLTRCTSGCLLFQLYGLRSYHNSYWQLPDIWSTGMPCFVVDLPSRRTLLRRRTCASFPISSFFHHTCRWPRVSSSVDCWPLNRPVDLRCLPSKYKTSSPMDIFRRYYRRPRVRLVPSSLFQASCLSGLLY